MRWSLVFWENFGNIEGTFGSKVYKAYLILLGYPSPNREPNDSKDRLDFKTLRGGHWFSGENFRNLEGPFGSKVYKAYLILLGYPSPNREPDDSKDRWDFKTL